MLAAIISLALLGTTLGLLLAFASNKFHIEVDQKASQVEEVLPGVNCGACGFAGCSGYASAIVEENKDITLCPVGGKKTVNEIAAIMGINNLLDDDPDNDRVAYVFCQGGTNAKDSYVYNGVKQCKAAIIYEMGQKTCNYGCLGFGDCIEACKFDAIKMGENGVPIVDKQKCIGCNACVLSCPKDIIGLVHPREYAKVTCKSHDIGKNAKEACTIACIGCGLCQKNCPYDAIKMDNFLAKIDPEKCTNCGICIEKCPTKAIK